jgi:hypothetical protein
VDSTLKRGKERKAKNERDNGRKQTCKTKEIVGIRQWLSTTYGNQTGTPYEDEDETIREFNNLWDSKLPILLLRRRVGPSPLSIEQQCDHSGIAPTTIHGFWGDQSWCSTLFPLAYIGIRIGRTWFGLVHPQSLLLEKDGLTVFANCFICACSHTNFTTGRKDKTNMRISASYSINFL